MRRIYKIFSGWTGVFFSPIYDFDSSDPSIAECLTFWIASAMRITRTLVLPKVCNGTEAIFHWN